jgi:hypothetical protein
VRLRPLDRVQQGERLDRWPGADLVFQRSLAGIEGQQRGSAVAAQIVQAYHVAVCRFAGPIEPKQRLGDRQRGGELAGLLEPARLPLEAEPSRADPLLALLVEPRVEGGRIGEAQVAEHAARLVEVVLDAGDEAHRLAAGDDLAALLPQLKQALRAASESLSGHSSAARRARAVGPSMASQASNAASRGAIATQEPSAWTARVRSASSRRMAIAGARRAWRGLRARDVRAMVAMAGAVAPAAALPFTAAALLAGRREVPPRGPGAIGVGLGPGAADRAPVGTHRGSVARLPGRGRGRARGE